MPPIIIFWHFPTASVVKFIKSECIFCKMQSSDPKLFSLPHHQMHFPVLVRKKSESGRRLNLVTGCKITLSCYLAVFPTNKCFASDMVIWNQVLYRGTQCKHLPLQQQSTARQQLATPTTSPLEQLATEDTPKQQHRLQWIWQQLMFLGSM